jgi:hypothetical protein
VTEISFIPLPATLFLHSFRFAHQSFVTQLTDRPISTPYAISLVTLSKSPGRDGRNDDPSVVDSTPFTELLQWDWIRSTSEPAK